MVSIFINRGLHPQTHLVQNTRSSHNNQGSNNQSAAGSRSHGVPPSFTIPFNLGALPTDLASMFMNMGATQGQTSQNRQEETDNVNGSEEPGIRIDGNINFNLGEQMPEDLTGALRSVMQMFSGTTPPGNTPDATHGSPM